MLEEVDPTSEEQPLEDDGYNPSLAYRVLEEDFSQMIEALERHDRLGHYSAEFHRVMEACREAHNKESELVDKNRKLHAQIATNATKLSAALKLSQADQETIDKLKQELDSAWHMVDAAHTREQLAQEALDALRLQVGRLQQEIELSKKMGADQDQEAGAMAKNKEAMAREKERLMTEVATAKERLTQALAYQQDLETKNDAADERITDLTNELETQKNELSKEKRFKEKLEDEVRDLKLEESAKQAEMVSQSNQIAQSNKLITKLENNIKDQKLLNDRLSKEVQDLVNAQKLARMEVEKEAAILEKMKQEIAEMKKVVKEKDELLARYTSAEAKQEKAKEALMKKIALLEDVKTGLSEEKGRLNVLLTGLEKEASEALRKATSDKKAIDSLKREKEMITKAAQKAAMFTQEQTRLISLQELHKKKLQEEVTEQGENIARQKAELSMANAEKERLTSEAYKMEERIEQVSEDLRFKQSEVFDCKRRLSDSDAKMKLQQQMYDQVRAEKNQMSKNLVEANDEISGLKHKLKVKTYQVEQLKEDITTKEGLIIKEEFAMHKVTKEKESVRIELQKTLTELKEAKDRIGMQQQQEKRLLQIVHEGDVDRAQLNKELTQVSNERDILGTQLVRRNDELSLLYEKIKILQCTLHNGENQYDQRLEDIRLLKIEIKKLRQEKAILARSMSNLNDLRQEIFHLERDFTRERLKCRALEEELQNPLNVHRWRKLEGSDPAAYELIQKIQILQKRLIASSEEAIKRENQLREAERLYLNLRQMLERQPGPETLEKLHKTQQALRERGVKMKCLVAELTMYENQISEYKFDLDQMSCQMTVLKKKYFIMKKREHRVKERETELNRDRQMLPLLEPIGGKGSKTKFVGGGFNVAPPCLARVASITTNA